MSSSILSLYDIKNNCIETQIAPVPTIIAKVTIPNVTIPNVEIAKDQNS